MTKTVLYKYLFEHRNQKLYHFRAITYFTEQGLHIVLLFSLCKWRSAKSCAIQCSRPAHVRIFWILCFWIFTWLLTCYNQAYTYPGPGCGHFSDIITGGRRVWENLPERSTFTGRRWRVSGSAYWAGSGSSPWSRLEKEGPCFVG